mmetsp:Transcript_30308/g.78302  ORF Transcript_30308/g.78302 Transcript_30308/m.78302 type:complete len:246 (-) Transcript_30308:153-890(-)
MPEDPGVWHPGAGKRGSLCWHYSQINHRPGWRPCCSCARRGCPRCGAVVAESQRPGACKSVVGVCSGIHPSASAFPPAGIAGAPEAGQRQERSGRPGRGVPRPGVVHVGVELCYLWGTPAGVDGGACGRSGVMYSGAPGHGEHGVGTGEHEGPATGDVRIGAWGEPGSSPVVPAGAGQRLLGLCGGGGGGRPTVSCRGAACDTPASPVQLQGARGSDVEFCGGGPTAGAVSTSAGGETAAARRTA